MIQVLTESHETPYEIRDRMALLGGSNRFGEPNFRAVWGWNRLDWIGGKWADWDEAGKMIRETAEVRYVPKYGNPNRWYIERWLPAERYGPPDLWYAQTLEIADGVNVPALGPFPARGDYECCFVLETPSGAFVQLTPAIAEGVVRRILAGERHSFWERRAAIERHHELKERRWERRVADILDYNPQSDARVIESKYKASQERIKQK